MAGMESVCLLVSWQMARELYEFTPYNYSHDPKSNHPQFGRQRLRPILPSDQLYHCQAP